MSQAISTVPEYNGSLHLCFELDEKTYAINAESIMEVTMLPSLMMPQKLPDNIVGILNYNSILINVIDLRKILNLKIKPYETGNQIIILKGDESLIAVIVDKVSDFISVDQTQMQQTSLDLAESFIKSFYHQSDNIINIINVSSLENAVKEMKDREGTINYPELFPKDELSKEIFEKRNKEIALKVNFDMEADFYGKDQYIVFEINGHTYCIYSSYVKELISLKNYTITKIPYTPDFIKGIINLKGDFYTVISLKEFIGFKDITKTDDEKIIVLESRDLKLAFLVDEIINMMSISKEQIQNKNDMRLEDLCIKAEIYMNGKVFNLLNLEKVINDKRLYIE